MATMIGSLAKGTQFKFNGWKYEILKQSTELQDGNGMVKAKIIDGHRPGCFLFGTNTEVEVI